MKKHALLISVVLSFVLRAMEMKKMRASVKEALDAAGVGDPKVADAVVKAGRVIPFG